MRDFLPGQQVRHTGGGGHCIAKGTLGVVQDEKRSQRNIPVLFKGFDYIRYIPQKHLVQPAIMKVGERYSSNASSINRKVVCVAHDRGKCVIRADTNHKTNYELVTGVIGCGKYEWTLYREPVVEVRYCTVHQSKWGTTDRQAWCQCREKYHNLKGTFTDDVLTHMESLL